MTDLTVAKTIIQQMGGQGRLVAMLGAYNFVGSENSVAFRFKCRAHNGANGLYIRLDPSDTYTVEFISCRGMSRKVKGSFQDIYAEDLRSLFEGQTGLYLSL
jgi:hypothetical protein